MHTPKPSVVMDSDVCSSTPNVCRSKSSSHGFSGAKGISGYRFRSNLFLLPLFRELFPLSRSTLMLVILSALRIVGSSLKCFVAILYSGNTWKRLLLCTLFWYRKKSKYLSFDFNRYYGVLRCFGRNCLDLRSASPLTIKSTPNARR